MPTSYDRLLYPTDPQDFACPAVFGALAALTGQTPPPRERYRALEIGCGDGVHLMAMALDAPESAFFGFDLSSTAIEAAGRLAAAARLDNVGFACRDILDHGIEAGAYDYVVAHGVYAWTPPEVRRATLDLIAHALTADGLAVVSFNVAPGCALRAALREIMRRAADGVDEPAQRIEAARAALGDRIARWDAADPMAAALAAEARTLLDKDPAILFHDDLAEIWAPVSLGDFAAAADAAGLAVVGDCDVSALRHLDAASDWLAAEQARDEIALTRFRRALLRRADGARPPRLAPEHLRGLCACAELTVERAPVGVVLRTPGGGRIETQDRVQGTFLIELAQSFPAGRPLDDLAAAPDARFDVLMQLVGAGVATLRARPAVFTLTPPGRPRVSALARAQLAAGRARIASLRGGAVEIDEAPMRAFLRLLDGTRDRAALAEAMARETGGRAAALAPAVAAALADAARMGLIHA
ncbi:MAG: class I SAM-dependent methyltransferase [Methylobacteriaceae bacterium]|nr:class I SAM-dependent methyltransferase [Methylobacteriaceae bacterium]